LLTLSQFNTILKNCLTPSIGSKANNFSGHSFRAALPSALASCQNLTSDAAIKKWGRWRSDAFEKYTRLNRQAKKEVFDLFKEALGRQ
jgi:hypothetical protein